MQSSFNSWYDRKMYATPELAEETRWVEQFLHGIHKVAVVGVSRKTTKDSYYVARYLQRVGYQIIPVNPIADKILREPAYPDLRSIQSSVDVVIMFLRPDHIAEAAEQALKLNPQCIWLQLGTGKHAGLEDRINQNGIRLIQNRCMKVDHQFLIRERN